MRTARLFAGPEVPVLGQGTWRMGEDKRKRALEVQALRRGLDLGLSLIDTAEMYGEGATEELVGEAIAGRRQEVFLVSKLYPRNATLAGTRRAAERSLARLKTDYLDLYLLHWPGNHPLGETLAAFQKLQDEGKIRAFGVSNFDLEEMEHAQAVPGGNAIATNQVLYNLSRRGIESGLLPWLRQRRIPLMAYSPIEQGRLLEGLAPLAQSEGIAPAQVALAWVLQQKNVIAIPKAGTIEHVEENYAALGMALSDRMLGELDRLFPAPKRRQPLEML